MDKRSEAFLRLLNIMDDLREKCPWDKKQTMDSLSYLTIEETYELIDAISAQDLNEVKGELGDLLLHIVFYAKIASETNEFDIVDVIHTVCDKLVERHPHIYGDVIAQTEEEVKANWEKIKLKKGKKSVLEGVPKSLPAMVKSTRIQEKARGVGFDWEHKDQVFEKVLEEFKELDNEINSGDDKAKVEKEFGDVLFSMINYARFIGVDPELALERTNKKFIGRFTYLESEVKKKQKDLLKMTLAEMDEIWNESKKKFP
ncbi:MAG: nucleoside triphosphate pyrophosphohydrolase [Bacteroidota bacterium]|jgi:XTP/dITP diphosphohydrolase|nr:nucleoside triphosphate pyrophosphohydrolase [Flavobacteriaceae bacterium]MEC9158856.1 nucleoside triphosphate pyrophosphohydrolase [Bacteroidota bacterium]|tara:strand:- start:1532 stop:2305 length:774 start_codon:yes stop_codon:yes gene_type:complete